MGQITGGRLAAEALEKKGVSHIFTLSGGHITPIYQYLVNTQIKMFDTRHEQSALFMAEAWGKLTRKPGVAMVTAGPGFTNSLTGIASASFSNTPVVMIAGCVGLNAREKLDLQDMRQAAAIEPMVKKAFVCLKTERIPEYVDMAFRTAVSGRPGPVYLELPVDVLNASVEADSVRHYNTSVMNMPVDIKGAARLVDMIEEAQKPMVIAGSGAWYADAGAEITVLAERAGLPVFTSLSGRGVVPDTHDFCFESSLVIRPGAALSALADTDLAIILGTRISLFYMFGDVINPSAKLIQADIQADEIGRNRSVDLGIVSDIRALVRECNAVLERRGNSDALKEKFGPWIDYLKRMKSQGKEFAELDWKSEETPIHPMRLMREIDDFMNKEDDIVVADGGDTTTWMGMTRTIRNAGHYLDYGLYGSLGVGLPYANAAKLLYPEKRVLLVTGDGSVGFNFMEFETALRKGLHIVVVIANDLGWGMIRHSQEIRMGKAIETGTWIGKVAYEKMVEGLGGKGFYVERPEDIRPALEKAFTFSVPVCINVMTDPTTVSPGSMALAGIGGYKG